MVSGGPGNLHSVTRAFESRNARLSRPVISYAQCQITPLVITKRSSFVLVNRSHRYRCFLSYPYFPCHRSPTDPGRQCACLVPRPQGGWCQTGSLSPLCQVPTLYSSGAMRPPLRKINYNRRKTNKKEINNSNKEKRSCPMACRSLDSSLLLIRN